MSWDWQDLGSRAGRSQPGADHLPVSSEADREAELDEAYERGFRDGEAAGLERALREMDPSRQAAEQAASQLTVLREAVSYTHLRAHET